MSRVTEESKRRVLAATDLVELAGRYTELRRTGNDKATGRCPLHDERTPSFSITPSKGLFKCFGCDAGGDALTLVQLKEGLDFPGALEFLARRAGIELEREADDPESEARRRRRARQIELLERAAAFYAAHLRSPRSAQATQAAEYLTGRGLHAPIRGQFALGFAPDSAAALINAAQTAGFSMHEIAAAGLAGRRRRDGAQGDRFRGRLMFPVADFRGRVVGFGARKLSTGRGAKYVNSPASAIYRKSELLYGAPHARAAAAKTGTVVVVEGYTDVLAMHQAGITNTVGLMGTALTDRQITGLKRFASTVVLLLDGDTAGCEAILRAGALTRPAGLEVLVALLPAGSDPADLLHDHGDSAITTLVAQARSFARFHVQHTLDRADLTSPEGKDRAVNDLRPVFAEIPSSAVREDLIATVADALQLQPTLVRSWMPLPDPATPDVEAPLPHGAAPPAARRHRPDERALLLRCIADRTAAASLPAGQPLQELFADALHRRAAEHIRDHPSSPTDDLPPDDPELVTFMTALLTSSHD